jgi:monoterpene epsilon-lactone hydrolase
LITDQHRVVLRELLEALFAIHGVSHAPIPDCAFFGGVVVRRVRTATSSTNPKEIVMSQQQKDALEEMLSHAPLDIGGDAIQERANFENMLSARPLADDVITTPGEVGGVPVLTIEAGGGSHDAVVLWFHGGWYVIGSPRTSAGLSSDLGRRIDAKVISVDYRLAPEHPYPAALHDARAAYRGLLDSGVDPHSIAIVGESAGGGLAVALLASLAEAGLAQPAATVLLSPWTDLTLSGETMTSMIGIDPVFTREKVSVRAEDYVGSADPADPSISPIFADLRGVSPVLIQTGSHEILLDDSMRLARRAAIDDVAITLDVTPGVPHGFQAFAAMLDEGGAALERAAAFLNHHLSRTNVSG